MFTRLITPSNISHFRVSILRGLKTGCINHNAAQSPLFKLRQKTGLAYSLCREALNKHENNLDEAEAWLKAQAMVHGSTKATKVRGRTTREGLIGLAINKSNSLASLLELNCETDFVARNQIFKDLVIELTAKIASQAEKKGIAEVEIPQIIGEVRYTPEEIKELDADIVPIITKLSENIKIQRITHFKSPNIQTKLFGQVHAQTGLVSNDSFTIMSGRFGALVALSTKPESNANKDLTDIGSRLCQHVIGYSPLYLELPDNIRKHLEEAERAEKEKLEKNNHVANQENDYDSEPEENQTPINSRDDWPSIMDQTLILSETTSVREFCANNSISLMYFNRFECSGDT